MTSFSPILGTRTKLRNNGTSCRTGSTSTSATEVEARILASEGIDSSDLDEYSADEFDLQEDGWCSCEKCLHMENAMERVCCRFFSEIIGSKFG